MCSNVKSLSSFSCSWIPVKSLLWLTALRDWRIKITSLLLPNIPNRCLDPLVSSQLLSALSQSRHAGIGSLLLPNRVQELWAEERGLWPWWSSPSLCPGCMWGTTGLHRVRLSWLLPTCVVSYLEGPLPVVSRLVQNRSYMAKKQGVLWSVCVFSYEVLSCPGAISIQPEQCA